MNDKIGKVRVTIKKFIGCLFIFAFALILTGCGQESGLKTPNDLKDVDRIISLAEKENPYYQGVLAAIYSRGDGTLKKDYEASFSYASKSADMKNPMGYYVLGALYNSGDFVKLDIEKSHQYYVEAFSGMLELANADDFFAQDNLGYMYGYGLGIEKDEKKALEWYRKAAAQGYDRSQLRLGQIYAKGNGVEKDHKKAVEWYRKAAEQGYAHAQRNMGQSYRFGKGIIKDGKKALEWYRKAAEQGYAAAQNDLGFLYEKGRLVEKDYRKAVEWYRKAAVQGYAGAQNNLGSRYVDGHGVEKDYQEALKWFRKAADQEYAGAQRSLSHMYKYGKGVVKDRKKAKEWYHKSTKTRVTDGGSATSPAVAGNIKTVKECYDSFAPEVDAVEKILRNDDIKLSFEGEEQEVDISKAMNDIFFGKNESRDLIQTENYIEGFEEVPGMMKVFLPAIYQAIIDLDLLDLEIKLDSSYGSLSSCIYISDDANLRKAIKILDGNFDKLYVQIAANYAYLAKIEYRILGNEESATKNFSLALDLFEKAMGLMSAREKSSSNVKFIDSFISIVKSELADIEAGKKHPKLI